MKPPTESDKPRTAFELFVAAVLAVPKAEADAVARQKREPEKALRRKPKESSA